MTNEEPSCNARDAAGSTWIRGTASQNRDTSNPPTRRAGSDSPPDGGIDWPQRTLSAAWRTSFRSRKEPPLSGERCARTARTRPLKGAPATNLLRSRRIHDHTTSTRVPRPSRTESGTASLRWASSEGRGPISWRRRHEDSTPCRNGAVIGAGSGGQRNTSARASDGVWRRSRSHRCAGGWRRCPGTTTTSRLPRRWLSPLPSPGDGPPGAPRHAARGGPGRAWRASTSWPCRAGASRPGRAAGAPPSRR